MNKHQRLNLLGILLAILFTVFYQLIWIFDPMRLGAGNIYWTELIDYIIYFFILIPMIWMLSSISDLIFLWKRRASIERYTPLRLVLICIKVIIILCCLTAIIIIAIPPFKLYYFAITVFITWFLVLINTLLEKLILLAKMYWRSIISIFILVLLVASIFWPLPYIVTYPGLTINMNKYVTVEDGYDGGEIMGVLVFERLAFPMDFIYAQLFPHYDFRPMYQEGEETHLQPLFAQHKQKAFSISENIEFPLEEELEIYKLLKLYANSVAVNVALREVNLADSMRSHGVLVVRVLNDFPAEQELKVGDIIKTINNEPISTVDEFFYYLSYVKPNDGVQLTVIRDGKAHQLNLLAREHPEYPGQAILDMQIIDILQLGIPYNINFHSFAVHEGGGSHGAILALTLMNQLTPEDLTFGNKVAGTGTITLTGHVGKIGGIKQKAYSVERAGADVFFVPLSQYEAALEGATDLIIVPVNHISDMLEWLQNNPKEH